MKRKHELILLAGLSPWVIAGCAPRDGSSVPVPAPLGSINDQIMRTQEENADSAKYIVYMHEFELNKTTEEGKVVGWRLNEYGEDHVKRIAVNLKKGQAFPVIVERSDTSAKPDTQYGYRVHFNEQLDNQRRQIVVAALERLGVEGADQQVVVASSTAEGYSGIEGSAAYSNSLRTLGNGGGFGFGGGGYGGGGFGGGGF